MIIAIIKPIKIKLIIIAINRFRRIHDLFRTDNELKIIKHITGVKYTVFIKTANSAPPPI